MSVVHGVNRRRWMGSQTKNRHSELGFEIDLIEAIREVMNGA